jgi:surface protein
MISLLHGILDSSQNVIGGTPSIFVIDTILGDGIDQYVIPTNNALSYFYNVYWEDVLNPSNNGTELGLGASPPTIVFPSPGQYRIEITGQFPHFYSNNSGDCLKLIEISQWGSTSWTSMQNAFYGCENLSSYTAIDTPDLSSVSDMSGMFRSCSLFNGDISAWDVYTLGSFQKNMSGMFQGATLFNQDIGSWNTTAVTNMSSMFYGAAAFNQDITSWDVYDVTNMNSMFYDATNFDQPIASWNTFNVTDMGKMFKNATSFNRNLGLLTGYPLQFTQHIACKASKMAVTLYSIVL